MLYTGVVVVCTAVRVALTLSLRRMLVWYVYRCARATTWTRGRSTAPLRKKASPLSPKLNPSPRYIWCMASCFTSTNQSIKRSSNQSIDRPINQSNNQATNQLVNQSIIRTISIFSTKYRSDGSWVGPATCQSVQQYVIYRSVNAFCSKVCASFAFRQPTNRSVYPF